jgi:hypothetical protein
MNRTEQSEASDRENNVDKTVVESLRIGKCNADLIFFFHFFPC